MSKEVKTTVVSYEEFTDIEFTPPATFFIVDAMQNYVFFHTTSRQKAQQTCDGVYGEGKYTVKASRLQKTKSKLESGGLSVTGTQSRRGQKR